MSLVCGMMVLFRLHMLDELPKNIPVRFVKYSFLRGPGQEVYRGGILEVNCQGWAHRRLTEEFGIRLPSWMLSEELYKDERFTYTVNDPQAATPGAIFLFGPKNLGNMRQLHWGLFGGYRTKITGEPILEHANFIDKAVGIWPLSQFFQMPRYEQLYAIKQPIIL